MSKQTTAGTISTTDLMTYDGEYKTDFDKFRDMSGISQAAIIGCGVITAGVILYGAYKGYKTYIAPKFQGNDGNTQYQYPYPQYYNQMVPNVNINGQYTPPTVEGGQPTVAFQANMQQPQSQPIPQSYQQPAPAYTQKIVDKNGNVITTPVTPVIPNFVKQ